MRFLRLKVGRTNLSALGERLRAKALTELDYDKIAEELSAEYSRISGKEQLCRSNRQPWPERVRVGGISQIDAPLAR